MSKTDLSFEFPSAVQQMRARLAAAIATVTLPFKRAHCPQLATLDGRQLRDAGIDLSIAGRGKAVAVSAVALGRLQGMSCG